jgi:nucleotide-binding universal stress UspA family protein
MASAHPLLVGYDGREESEIAFDLAIAEARQRGTSLIVLVVAGLPPDVADPLDPGGFGMGSFPEMTPDGPALIQPIMDAARRKLADSGVPGEVEWSLGDPATEIVRLAEEHEVETIVVGTHHHSALGRLLGTDVAAAVMRRASSDVLVAR